MARAPLGERLRHILDAIARIESRTAGTTLEGYAADWITRDVVERNLERLSEASRHIPSEIKSKTSEHSLACDRRSREPSAT